ncbi:hypothetical protein GCM10009836_24810 [Pseudonocardia ailaonensis]|uniref:SnoaL-like domain-containing protein n=1 Tax=Pseudonocardia ailaonensis TaxID=367279 RepID=A0ABN2MYX9_9PSEU
MVTASVDHIVAIVERFHRDMGRLAPDEATNLFTDYAYIQMMMKEPYVGREEIHEMFTIWFTSHTDIVTTPRTVTGQDNRVAVEWVDISDHEGKHYEVPCFGIFEFDGDKIAAWRLYYDYALERGQKAGLKLPIYETAPQA